MAWFISLSQTLSGSQRARTQAWSTFWKLSARLWRPSSPASPAWSSGLASRRNPRELLL